MNTSQNLYQYNTVSWNIGGVTDFIGLCRRAGKQPWKAMKEVSGIHRERLKGAFNKIIESQRPDFLFLQEVGGIHSGLENWLDKYTIHFDGDDTLVAWNKNRFSEVSGSRQSQQLANRFSIVDLIDNTTQKVVRIASIHLHGFDLSQPDRRRCGRRVTEGGDEELRQIMQLLFDCSVRTPEIILLGMDANSTPDIHPERLEILESKGFVRDFNDNTATAFNPTLSARKAKLDYIYAKCISGNCAVETSSVEPVLEIESPDSNPSDHRPLYKTVVLRESL